MGGSRRQSRQVHFSDDAPKSAPSNPQSQPAATTAPGDIPPVGATVEHMRFGRGKVIEVDTTQPDARIVVQFSESGTKTLLLKYAKITIIE
jgi:DNA helicase-2/ATP-dependent DNA helicase PcrA